LWIATIFPYIVFFLFFLWFFFSNWSLSIFFLYRAGWEFSFVVFLKITLWIATVFPPRTVAFPTCFFFLLLFPLFFYMFFFSKIDFFFFLFFFKLSLPIFLNIELVENLAMQFFFKTLWIATIFPYIVFFSFYDLFHFFSN